VRAAQSTINHRIQVADKAASLTAGQVRVHYGSRSHVWLIRRMQDSGFPTPNLFRSPAHLAIERPRVMGTQTGREPAATPADRLSVRKSKKRQKAAPCNDSADAGRINPLLAGALAYGKLGWKVFPIREGTKERPRLREWGVYASSNPRHITKWWTAWPRTNIGLACRPSLIAVVDVDTKEGKTYFLISI